ncbi:MAG: response regulator [Nitrospirae bacterium]|nr:response regulator [Nitrospirota bacterium]
METSTEISDVKVSSGIKILIVEDEIVVGRDIEIKLKKAGYGVSDICSTGEKAIEKVGQFMPDLVLMDITLAGEMDGIEAAKQIGELYQIPIVYLTAHSDLATLDRAKITEPFGYIVKPFNVRDLIITIAMALYKHKMQMKLHVINKMLRVFLQQIPFEEKLNQAIHLMVSIPRLFLQTRGCIFLIDEKEYELLPDCLVAKAYIGGEPECETVPIGECLCGLALKTGEIVIAGIIDNRHTRHRDDSPHGHYCVPIKANNRVLGVISVYLAEGYKRDVGDENILASFADIIANELVSLQKQNAILSQFFYLQ